MAWTQDDYNALKDAIKSGAKKVKYSDKEVEYRSLDEMMQLLRAMQAEINPPDTGSRVYPSFSKGTT